MINEHRTVLDFIGVAQIRTCPKLKMFNFEPSFLKKYAFLSKINGDLICWPQISVSFKQNEWRKYAYKMWWHLSKLSNFKIWKFLQLALQHLKNFNQLYSTKLILMLEWLLYQLSKGVNLLYSSRLKQFNVLFWILHFSHFFSILIHRNVKKNMFTFFDKFTIDWL